jgi:inorganic pyrophosphatase
MSSKVTKLGCGKNFPEAFNVVIEVEANALPVKYEYDKDSDFMIVDRFIATPMHYPCNYGFVPCTLSDDGDPADVLVISPYAIRSGCSIECRAVGVLIMEDEKGMDEKIIAVPSSGVTKMYDHIKDVNDVNPALLNQIKHFFEHYKDLEKGKWVKVKTLENTETAVDLLTKAKANYK